MATSIGQYAPVFLPGEFPALTEKPGRPQSTGSQRVRKCQKGQSDPVCIDARLFFACGISVPMRAECEGGTAAWLVGLWQHQVCRDMDCLCHRSYGPIRVFFWASHGWCSEGLLDQCFSVALPFQALRGLPCLGFFSVVWRTRHIKGPGPSPPTPPAVWGPTL